MGGDVVAGNFLTDLVARLRPPDVPVLNTGDWHYIEERLCTPLPDDYKEFIRIYGAGSIEPAKIWVIDPFYRLPDAEGLASSLRRGKDAGITLPFSAFPALDGLLPWGANDAGDQFTWRIKGDPGGWDTVVLYDEFSKYVVLPGTSCTHCLFELVTGTSVLLFEAMPRIAFATHQVYQPIKAPSVHSLERACKLVSEADLTLCYNVDGVLSMCVPKRWVVRPVPSTTSQYGDYLPYFMADSGLLTARAGSGVPSSVSLVLVRKPSTPVQEARHICQATKDRLTNEWELYERESRESFSAWAAEVGLAAASAESPTVDYGGRHFRFGGEGEVVGMPTNIPWLLYSVYQGKWVISYFWSNGGDWRLDCFLEEDVHDELRPTLDSIAASVTFSNQA